MWILPITVACIGAYFFMNNLTVASASLKEHLVVVKRKHTWVTSYIYIGMFGSFILFSGVSLAEKTYFPEITVGVAFLARWLAWLSRPFGGLLSDKVGGANVTFWIFIAMCRGGARRDVLRGAKELCRLPHHVSGSFHSDRRRQWLDLSDDSRDLPRGEASAKPRARARLPARSRSKQAGLEAAAALGFIGAVGAVRRLPHPARVRRSPLPQPVGPISRFKSS